MSFFLLMFGFACGFVVGWYWSRAFYRKSAAPANGFTPPYPMPPAARPSWARPEDEDGVAAVHAPNAEDVLREALRTRGYRDDGNLMTLCGRVLHMAREDRDLIAMQKTLNERLKRQMQPMDPAAARGVTPCDGGQR
jgi:hypothetical protein